MRDDACEPEALPLAQLLRKRSSAKIFLQGDGRIQPFIERFIDRAHSTLTPLGEQRGIDSV